MHKLDRREGSEFPLSAMETEAILRADARGISVLNREGIFRFVSNRFCELFARDSETFIGCAVETILPELRLSRLNFSAPESYDMALTRQDGRNLPARVTTQPLVSAGAGESLLLYVQDLTEEKHVEEMLRKTERLASAGRMAAAIAHEINNPLEAVMNLLFLLRNEVETQQGHHLLSLTESELERVSRIARQTLAFYRESSKAGSVDVRELLNMAVSVHSVRASELRVHRRYRTAFTVFGYAPELQQVFHNLIGNAIDAGAKDIFLHLSHAVDSAPPHRAGVWVTIGDNGCGIDPKLHGQIFNPFFTTKGDRGTGLGLWTSRGIIVRHEGSIRFRSSIMEGRSGTCFRIFLPR